MSYKFNFKTIDELLAAASALGVNLPYSEGIGNLFDGVSFGTLKMPNRLVIQPMEGCDGEPDGSPSELVRNRYKRFARSGAGLIWAEACAVTEEARANPLQLYIHAKNIKSYAEMVKMIRKEAADANGADFKPLIFLQLTHSGRYSKPHGAAEPIIAHNSPLDKFSGVTDETRLVTDEYLAALPEKFAEAAVLALDAGFDGVDIKACHRYLFSELLASHSRENSVYGGNFENRKRLIIETINAVNAALKGRMEVTSRLNVYDGMEYPYGFGGSADGKNLDMTEPLKLIGEMESSGYHGINITVGNPYFSPHLNRPYDKPIVGGYEPPEPQIIGINRFTEATAAVQNNFKKLNVIMSGFTWLREYFPYIASGVIKNGGATSVGLGRLAFAYPDFPRDLREYGKLDGKKVCISCSKCSQLMRNNDKARCVFNNSNS